MKYDNLNFWKKKKSLIYWQSNPKKILELKNKKFIL